MQNRILPFFIVLLSYANTVAAYKDTALVRIEKISSPREKAVAYNHKSAWAWENGNYNATLDYSTRGLEIARAHNYLDLQAGLLNNRGVAYDYLGEYTSSLECYFEALKIQEKLNDPAFEATILSNIGLIYSNQGLTEKALTYHTRALKINRQENNTLGVCANLNNLAILYVQQGKFGKAVSNYEECIRIDKQLGDENGLGDDYNNIAICYLDMKEFSKAKKYLDKALEIRLKLKNRRGVAETYTNIASLYQNQEQWKEARDYYLLSLPLSQDLGSKESLRYTYENLHKIEEALGNMGDAYRYYQLFIAYRDSIINIDQTRAQTELELSYEYEKEKERDQLLQEKRDERARIILYSVIAFAVLILGFFALLYKRWKYTKRQQVIIEEKTVLVQQKNDEILDSITYAKRIQTAILPSDEFVKEVLPDSFILYLPKDIVAGDFYWLEEEGSKLFFAVADCTGHGVPGAMMSVVCHNALNRALHEFRLTDPARLLEKTRLLIIENLSKNNSAVADGMDVSLCMINREAHELQWAGANSPLWIYRSASNSIEVIKGDKQPIGIQGELKPFKEHSVKLDSNDRIYLLTDGFADQFGGEKGKKLMSRQFSKWILESSSLSLDEQKQFLLDRFMLWKGSHDQVDDICVAGVEIRH